MMFLISLMIVVFSGCGSREEPSKPGKATDIDRSKPAPGITREEASKKIKIGFLLETYDVARWARDEAYFKEKAESLGAEVLSAIANGDQDKQNQQADTFLTQGVNVLVVVPKNLKTAARIVKSAHEKNVPVVAYDRLIRNCDLDIYITFDNEKVGFLQAKGVLEKAPEGNYILLGGAATDNNAVLLRNGQKKAIQEHEQKTGKKITILDESFLDNWDKEEARRKISNLLTKFKAEAKAVNAIVASNDGTAGGAIAALKAENLDAKVAVSGQDAELTACQRIMEGTQTVTVYKPVRRLAYASAEIAVRLARGEKPEQIIKSMGSQMNLLNNDQKDVPSLFLEPVFVTRHNMADTVIADGWHPLDKVYANVPKDQWPTK